MNNTEHQSRLQPGGWIDSHILQGLTAMEALPSGEVAMCVEARTEVFTSPWTSAFSLSALQNVDRRYSQLLLDRHAEYLLGAQNAASGWLFRSPEKLSDWDLDTSVCAEAALLGFDRCASAQAPAKSERTWRSEIDAFDRTDELPLLDLGTAASILYWRAMTGRDQGELSAWVAVMAAKGQFRATTGIRRFSPFFRTFLLTRWLQLLRSQDEHKTELREAVASYLRHWLRSQPPRQSLSIACALYSMFELDSVTAEVHPLADQLLRQQEPGGLWPAGIVCRGSNDELYMSLSMTAAVCVEALSRYVGGAPGQWLRRGQTGAPAASGRPRPGTLDQSLQELRDCLPAALISLPAQENLYGSFCGLPAELSHGLGFESRLGDPLPAADFILLVSRDGGRILAGRNDGIRLHPDLRAHPVWRRLQNWSMKWTDEANESLKDVQFIWLEFDVHDAAPPVPVPSIFLHLCDEVQEGDESRFRRCIEESLFHLTGAAPASGLIDKLVQCRALVPTEGNLFGLGVMLARDCPAVRITIKDIQPRDLIAYLDNIGWPGPKNELEQLLDLADCSDRIICDLDVAQTVLPSIGMEYKLTRPPREDARWARLLDSLVSLGLCLEDKAEALLSWPGPYYAERPIDGEIWTSCFSNSLSHVKVAIQPNRNLQAKAYFGSWRWLSGSRSLVSTDSGSFVADTEVSIRP